MSSSSSNTHEGVSCDICAKSNFSGKRYKCLICYDFDLCSSCHDKSIQSLNTATSSTNQPLNPTATTGTTTRASNPNHNHLNTHPMQCILTRNDYELYYGSSGPGSSNANSLSDFVEHYSASFTCPYCGKLGFSEITLCDHISVQHINAQSDNVNNNMLQEVVCPICAALPSSNGGDPNHLTEDLLNHINLEHLNNPLGTDSATAAAAAVAGIVGASSSNTLQLNSNNLNSIFGLANLSSNTNQSGSTNVPSSATAVAAAAALRFSRRINYAASSLGQNSGSGGSLSSSNQTRGTLTGGRNLSNNASSSIGRFTYQFGSNTLAGSGNSGSSSRSVVGSGGGPAAALISSSNLSSFMRSTSSALESLGSSGSGVSGIDPIAELLSQLTGVRRAAASAQSTHLQLHQLQAQLNREREQFQQQQSSSSGSSRHNHHSHHLFSNSKSSHLNSLTNKSGSASGQSQQSNNQNSSTMTATQTVNFLTNALTSQILELPTNTFQQPLPPNTRDPRFLLTKYDFSTINDSSNNPKYNPINQSLFVNDVILAVLIKQINDMNLNSSVSHQANTVLNPTTSNELLVEDLLEQQQLVQQQQQEQQQQQL